MRSFIVQILSVNRNRLFAVCLICFEYSVKYLIVNENETEHVV